ncbi:MAG: G8 domain-containing protein [Cytophagaceae bacterium]|nr:G8 domain-containing protein [Cytophagaceae bacterium]
MKKIIFILLFLISNYLGFSATRTFCGASGGNWNVASNWCSGNPAISGTLPVAGDDIIIPTGITVIANSNIGPIFRSITVNGTLNVSDNGKVETTVLYINASTGSTFSNSNNDKLKITGGTTYSGNEINTIPKGVAHGTIPPSFPVKLSNFSSDIIISKIKLNWETREETNFSKFDIQRSFDSKSFESIGLISGSGEGSYVFFDDSPKPGNNYYRLKMIDQDGSFEFSKIISQFYHLETSSLLVFPNPVENKIFEIKTQKEFSDFQIFNISGKRINAEVQKNIDHSLIILKDNIEKQSLILQANVDGKIVSQKIYVN